MSRRIRISDEVGERLDALLGAYCDAVGSTQTAAQLVEALITRCPSVDVLAGPPARWIGSPGQGVPTPGTGCPNYPGQGVPTGDLGTGCPSVGTGCPGTGCPGLKSAPQAAGSGGTDDANARGRALSSSSSSIVAKGRGDYAGAGTREGVAEPILVEADPDPVPYESIVNEWNAAATSTGSPLISSPCPPPPGVLADLVARYRAYPHLDNWLDAIRQLAEADHALIARIGMSTLAEVLRIPGGDDEGDCVLLRFYGGKYPQRRTDPKSQPCQAVAPDAEPGIDADEMPF